MREYFTAAEIVAIGSPALPATERGLQKLINREGWRDCARRAGVIDGCWRFHLSLLPADVQARLIAAEAGADAPSLPSPASGGGSRAGDGRGIREQASQVGPARSAHDQSRVGPARSAHDQSQVGPARSALHELWDRYARLPQKAKDAAARRLAVVERVALLAQGMPLRAAIPLAAREADVSASAVWTWHRAASAVEREHRLAALAPRHAGRTATAECHRDAWEFIKADYLRSERPAFDACYRRLIEAAAAQGWSPVPSMKTLRRRIDREFPRAARVLLRQGAEAAARTYPAQQRDRSVFAAMQAVNADGHKLDVFVRLEDGKIGRLVLVAIQDLYSGMIVGWRLDRSENWHAVRLAFADAVASYGIPEVVYLDNGRAFASKWITGGAKTRYRFRVRADEPEGVLTRLGVRTQWVSPYHGQSKPIERAFRDLAEEIARHPYCAGAYTGSSPEKKPDNYGQRAIPVEDFERHVAEQIARHNLRAGRRTATAGGRSFEATFRESYARALIRKPSAEQLHELLLAAEGVACRRPEGSVHLADNRYWHEALADYAGRKVVVRFDPGALFEPVAVYTLDGRFVCAADCVERTGFDDIAAARAHAKARQTYLRRLREIRDLEITMSLDDLVRALPPPAAPERPAPRIVKLVAGGRRPAAAAADCEPETDSGMWAAFGRAVSALDPQAGPARSAHGDPQEGAARPAHVDRDEDAAVLPFPSSPASGGGGPSVGRWKGRCAADDENGAA